MKTDFSCIAAALLLIAVAILSAGNYIYIERSVSSITEILNEASSLSTASEKDIDELADAWSDLSHVITLSSMRSDIRRIDELLEDLRVAFKSYDVHEYNKAMAHLRRAIADIKKREGISFDNIF